jgi:hypothetical protein
MVISNLLLCIIQLETQKAVAHAQRVPQQLSKVTLYNTIRKPKPKKLWRSRSERHSFLGFNVFHAAY